MLYIYDWLTNGYYVDDQLYIIFKCYVLNMMVIDYVLIVKFYFVLVFLFFFKVYLCIVAHVVVTVMILNSMFVGANGQCWIEWSENN